MWSFAETVRGVGGAASLATEDELTVLCSRDTEIDAGKAGISLSPYPSVVAKTYSAMEVTEGRGFWMGVVPRAFLRTRLVARGIFSTVFGLVGLG